MNMLASFLQGQNAGLANREYRTEQANKSRLSELAPQIIAGDAGAFAQGAAIDPKAAQGYQDAGDAQLRKLQGFIKYVDGARATNNPAAVRAALQQGGSFIQQLTGKPAPTDWTPDMDEGWEQLKARVSMVPDVNGATPTDVRSFEMMTAGLSPEDKMRARRTNLGLDGRASSAGYGFFEFEGADGRKRMGRNNPRTGAREMYDEASGDFVPLGGMSGGTGGSGVPAPQAPGQQSFGDFTSLAGEFPGITMTSGMRTAERNQQVGGAGNSQHLTGTAADYAVPPQLKPAFISRAKQLGYQAIDEGDHIHLQLPRGARAGANLTVGRRAEDTAAAVEQAKAGVQLANLPTELGMRTNAAIAQTQGQEQVKQGVERAGLQATKARDAGTALELIAEARRLLPDATGGGLGAAADSTAGFFGQATQGAEANAALKTIAGQMTSKMPRMEGPQSDRDVQMYKEMAGDIGNASLPVRIRLASLDQIERLNQKYANNPSSGQGAPAQQGAAIRIESAEDYSQLPSGALYIAPDGMQRRKR